MKDGSSRALEPPPKAAARLAEGWSRVRYLALPSGLVAAAAAGFALVLALSGERAAMTPDWASLDAGDPARSSTRPKSPSAPDRTLTVIAKSAPVNRQAGAGPAQQADLPASRADPYRSHPLVRAQTRLLAFAASPFPYDGIVPSTRQPFLNVSDGGRLGHKTFSGRVYWADRTYSDRRVLLHIPKGFDSQRPGVMVLFFHGHGATLARDVLDRQQVPEQISESGMNAVLVAPQFAVDARDSSAGKLWTADGMREFLREAAEKLAQLHGNPLARQAFATMPVVVVGYSGGYVPTASALASGVADGRIKGAVLLDGLYGEVDKFADWIDRNERAFFLSAYTASTKRGNEALQRRLAEQKIPYRTAMAPRLGPGSVTFIAADTAHRDYVTRAWSDYPISDLLRRITGIAPRTRIDVSASLAAGPTR